MFFAVCTHPCNLLSKKTCWAGTKTEIPTVYSLAYTIYSPMCGTMEFISRVWELAGGERLSWVNTQRIQVHTSERWREDINLVVWTHNIVFFFFFFMINICHSLYSRRPNQQSDSHDTHQLRGLYIWLRLDGWSLPGFLNSNVISHSALGLMGLAVEYLVWSEAIRVPLLSL